MYYTKIPMVPGPVIVPDSLIAAYAQNVGSGQIEHDFIALYAETSKNIAEIMLTKNQVVIMTGEGMLALWAGLKSCLVKGDKVLCLSTGFFGSGIGEMAAAIGCEVKTIEYGYDASINDFDKLEKEIKAFKPHMITAVHCETPSGTFNPIDIIGKIKKNCKVPLFYVDAVSSLGGTLVCMDEWNVDLLLGGTQKCFSAPPNLSFLGISSVAWEKIEQVKYVGYDALAPWKNVYADGRCPYTPYWHGIAVLKRATELLLEEGLKNVFKRHDLVAEQCRSGLQSLGIKLWNNKESIPATTVSAAYIPQGISWKMWDSALREHGLVVAGSFGPMENKVFRLGHMGSQATESLVKEALDAIKKVMQAKNLL